MQSSPPRSQAQRTEHKVVHGREGKDRPEDKAVKRQARNWDIEA